MAKSLDRNPETTFKMISDVANSKRLEEAFTTTVIHKLEESASVLLRDDVLTRLDEINSITQEVTESIVSECERVNIHPQTVSRKSFSSMVEHHVRMIVINKLTADNASLLRANLPKLFMGIATRWDSEMEPAYAKMPSGIPSALAHMSAVTEHLLPSTAMYDTLNDRLKPYFFTHRVTFIERLRHELHGLASSLTCGLSGLSEMPEVPSRATEEVYRHAFVSVSKITAPVIADALRNHFALLKDKMTKKERITPEAARDVLSDTVLRAMQNKCDVLVEVMQGPADADEMAHAAEHAG